jgi:site-specific recombinase XerD
MPAVVRPLQETSVSSLPRVFLAYAGGLYCVQAALELDVKKIPMKKRKRNTVNFLSENALKTPLEQPDTKKMNGICDRFFMMLMYDTPARYSESPDLRI